MKKGSCKYKGSEGGNMFGGFSNFTYNIRGYGKIDASDSQQAKEDAKGQPTNIYTYKADINKKKATRIWRADKSFKFLGKHEYPEGKKVLMCIQANDKSIELCTD